MNAAGKSNMATILPLNYQYKQSLITYLKSYSFMESVKPSTSSTEVVVYSVVMVICVGQDGRWLGFIDNCMKEGLILMIRFIVFCT